MDIRHRHKTVYGKLVLFCESIFTQTFTAHTCIIYIYFNSKHFIIIELKSRKLYARLYDSLWQNGMFLWENSDFMRPLELGLCEWPNDVALIDRWRHKKRHFYTNLFKRAVQLCNQPWMCNKSVKKTCHSQCEIQIFLHLNVPRPEHFLANVIHSAGSHFGPQNVTHSDWGVHVSYQLCCCTKRKAKTWKTRQVRIWVRTEQSSGPEIRLDGGRRHTSSFHDGFRLTDNRKKPSMNICQVTQSFVLVDA